MIKKVKMLVDILMTVALLLLMAFQVTGNEYHEWIGSGMLILFLLHNGLNFRWYRSIFKGKYSVMRILRTLINFAVLIAIVLVGYSGIVMSRYVFDFLPINGGIALARRIHLAGSYWAFVLMGIHLGMHWGMVTGMVERKVKNHSVKQGITWVARIIATMVAVYGAIGFGRSDIYSYMFMENQFAMLDYEKAALHVIMENMAMLGTWIYIGYYGPMVVGRRKTIQRVASIIAAAAVLIISMFSIPEQEEVPSWGQGGNFQAQNTEPSTTAAENITEQNTEEMSTMEGEESKLTPPTEGFVLIKGGTFQMGSPESEAWRSDDEISHTVSVSDFYMSAYEVTQEEYQAVTGSNPSTFSGDELPVERVTWMDAVNYCNARSTQEGLEPVYQIDGRSVSWNRAANGYRLPTEAEWEYACRAGTTTPFNTETSISPEESNYYGHYPYDIEENYFEQENLSTKPGQYRQTTVPVDSFSPNAYGLYNMHGNVSEWVWDYYGTYDTANTADPTGPATGSLKVYRGGGWNDFAKNMRSAYRATLEENKSSFNIGIRLVRNAAMGDTTIVGGENQNSEEEEMNDTPKKILIAYFSWSGNTKNAAEEIQDQTGADIFEIELEHPYSSNYNTVLDQSQRDQNVQARPEIADHIDNMDEYDTILLGYPNWWASIPMPIASFLEEYDFSGKIIIPFCSHGGGRFGQSLTAIAKLAPDARMGEGLSIHYSGGSSLNSDIEKWLEENGL